jgi:hypothetical protein
MKLNKEQVSAIAYEFYSKLKEENDKLNKKLIKDQEEKFRPDYNKGIKLLEKNDWLDSVDISVAPGRSATVTKEKSFEKFLMDWDVQRLIETKGLDISLTDIKNSIVLATIEANNLDEVMEVLKNKFK